MICIVLLVGLTAVAQYKIGDAVACFSLKNVNGKLMSLADYKKARGFIIVFTANHCPFAKRYQQRMNEFSKKYEAMGMPLLAVSSNDASVIPEDTWDEMKARAKQQHYIFPYLYDETQAVAKAFGVSKTPQAFLIFMENGQWRLRYSGAIDDNGAEPEKVKNHYLEDAVNACLQGKPVAVPVTKSVGCGIKWKVQ